MLPVRSISSSRARVLLMPLLWISLTGENSGIEMSSSFEAGLKYDNVRNHIYYIFTQPPHAHILVIKCYLMTHLTSIDCTSLQDPVCFTSSGSSLMTGGDRFPIGRGFTGGLPTPSWDPPLSFPPALSADGTSTLCSLLASAVGALLFKALPPTFPPLFIITPSPLSFVGSFMIWSVTLTLALCCWFTFISISPFSCWSTQALATLRWLLISSLVCLVSDFLSGTLCVTRWVLFFTCLWLSICAAAVTVSVLLRAVSFILTWTMTCSLTWKSTFLVAGSLTWALLWIVFILPVKN